MATLFKLVSCNCGSGHVGALCTITAGKATLGEDYGLPNLMALSMNAGKTINPSDVYKNVMVHYEDGAYRQLGLKARVIKKDEFDRIQLWLYGNNSVFNFQEVGTVSSSF